MSETTTDFCMAGVTYQGKPYRCDSLREHASPRTLGGTPHSNKEAGIIWDDRGEIQPIPQPDPTYSPTEAAIETKTVIRYWVEIWGVIKEEWINLGSDDAFGNRRRHWAEHADPKYYDRSRMRTKKETTVSTCFTEVLP